MTTRLRNRTSTRGVTARTIGDWPATRRTRSRGIAANHARTHWRETAARMHGTIDQQEAAVVAFEFVSRIARTVSTCPDCERRTPTEPHTPAEWLWWALMAREPTRNIIGPITAQTRGTGRLSATPPPGWTPVKPLPKRPRRAAKPAAP